MVLCIPDADAHRDLILKRGEQTSKGADKQVEKFNRIRMIHDEMVRLGHENNWVKIETKLLPDPVEVVADLLNNCNLE